MDTNCIFGLVAGIMLVVFGCTFIGMGCRSLGDVCSVPYFITGIGVLIMGIVVIVASLDANNSAKERDELESEVVESYKDGAELYINGEKKDNIDLNGVNLDNYDITVEKDKIYLKEK